MALAACQALSCSDVRVVAVEIAVLEVEPSAASIPVGDSVQLMARVLDRSGNTLSGHEITWSSSNADAVPVDATGLVRGLSAGHATITAAAAGWHADADVAVNRPAPGLTAVQPSSAQRLQTLDLVLTGSNFEEGASTVDLGEGISVDGVSITSAGSITLRVTIQAGAALGERDVFVTNAGPGGGTATLAGGFTVLAEHPSTSLTGVTPAEGQRQATLDVTLSGSGFVPGVTTLSFGPNIGVEDLTVGSATSLTATIQIGATAALGARDVSVTNPAPGGGTATLADKFTVHPANPVPALTAVSPVDGRRLTTLDVTLTGSGFMNGTVVSFGPGVTVGQVTVASPTSLTATITISAGATLGARDVTVTNAAPGGGGATLAGGFTILAEHPQPAIDGVEPAEMQRRDRRAVTVTGSGFVPGVTTVTFGPDITVEESRVEGSTSLTATIHILAGATLGTRPVSVTNPEPGGGTGTLPDGFTVLEENPAPSASEVIPAAGLRGATLTVTVLGSGFVQGLTSVSFGQGITVNSVNVIFWTSLSASISIASDAEPGDRDVAVTNPPPGGGTFIMHQAFKVLSDGR